MSFLKKKAFAKVNFINLKQPCLHDNAKHVIFNRCLRAQVKKISFHHEIPEFQTYKVKTSDSPGLLKVVQTPSLIRKEG